MASIDLVPALGQCIESTAKKVYKGLVSLYLNGNSVTSDADEKIALLSSFLTTADFKKLRQESEMYLLHGRKVIFTIFNEENETKYTMKVE